MIMLGSYPSFHPFLDLWSDAFVSAEMHAAQALRPSELVANEADSWINESRVLQVERLEEVVVLDEVFKE